MEIQLNSAPTPLTDDLQLPKRGMPVTIITGFLGSGKTTLLNHILQAKHQQKIAVLVNEFGDIDIDSQLLVSVEEDMVQLSNGCICCTINDNLVEAVYNILERKDNVDQLVIETTGVADPLPIILTFLGSELKDLTRLDAVITLVDTDAFTTEHFQSDAALSQVTYGDIVVLNKIDLASPEKIIELENWISDSKAGARILRAKNGQVPLNFILDIDQFSAQAYQEKLKDLQQSNDHSHHDASNHDHHHHDSHDHHSHHEHDLHDHHSHHLEIDGFVSVAFESDRPFALNKFQKFLDDVLPTDVFRAKGFLWFEDSQQRCIFQLSGGRYTLNFDTWPAQPRIQFVLIGRQLDAKSLQSQLEDCLLDASV